MKVIRGRELLTIDQRKSFMKIPEDECIVGSYYSFSKQDLEIIKRHRKEENQLGFAVQLAVLRYPGWPYTYTENIPESVLKYIAKQINVTPKGLKVYSQRKSTSREHIREIKIEYGFFQFSSDKGGTPRYV